MESTEQIIEEYLRFVKKWFYLTDIKFKVPGNYSNIDLIAIADIKDESYDIESKFRSAYHFNIDEIKDITKQLLRKERQEKIKEFTKRKPIKVLVIYKECFGKEKTGKFQKLVKQFHKKIKRNGFKSEIWFIEDIIELLRAEIKKSGDKGRYDSAVLQTIRLINRSQDKAEKINNDGKIARL